MADKHLGQLAFVRVYSGTVASGSYVFNTIKGTKERVGRLMRMHANKREDIESASAGEIIAIGGMKNVTTGDTVSDESKHIILESMEFPDPVIRVAVEPKTRQDQDKMGVALNRLAAEDPSFRVSTDHETGPDDHRGNGRAPPRDYRGPHEAGVRCRGQRRQTAGSLSRDDHWRGSW